MASTYAGYGPNDEVILIEERDQLCLLNTKIMMLREGRIIFNGSDEELFISEDKYIRDFLLHPPTFNSLRGQHKQTQD